MSKKYTVELTALAQEQILQIGEYIRRDQKKQLKQMEMR